MIRALVFDCFGVIYQDPVFAYARGPGASASVIAALSDISDQAFLGNMSKAAYVEKASALLGESADSVERQFFSGP